MICFEGTAELDRINRIYRMNGGSMDKGIPKSITAKKIKRKNHRVFPPQPALWASMC
jgi:hypothetical protein